MWEKGGRLEILESRESEGAGVGQFFVGRGKLEILRKKVSFPCKRKGCHYPKIAHDKRECFSPRAFQQGGGWGRAGGKLSKGSKDIKTVQQSDSEVG